jgi:23S rRNA (guanine2445-N2)-methyltransferase / 23S rRNA (guanine2069-N7)-methyltransferase
MSPSHRFFATAPKGIEPLLADELRRIGAGDVELGSAGVAFTGGLEVGYRACLWSRTASRVLLPLATFDAPTAEALYEGARTIDWLAHVRPTGTLAIDFSARDSQVAHTHFGALKVKDAIADQLREATGSRPSVDLERPELRVNAYLFQDKATLSLDLSGESLHRRGYRVQSALAPLKENLAAALLLLAGWPAERERGGGFLDPMCGSGTLCIEAGLMAADVAPGLLRAPPGLTRWLQHDAALWSSLLDEARQRDRRASGDWQATIEGFDMDASAIRAARANARKAGLGDRLRFEQRELSSTERPEGLATGILMANPPYGERLGELRALGRLYRRLGDVLKQRFAGWTGFVFTGNLDLTKEVGLRIRRRHVLFNGAIGCRLLEIPIESGPARTNVTSDEAETSSALRSEAQGFANRLDKNFRHLSKWARREGITCFRVYDADLPDYALAIDLYDRWVHVQEYAPPKSIDPVKAERRLQEALSIIPRVLGVLPSDVHLKVRQRQRGHGQYEKFGDEGTFHEVSEGGLKFLVNLTDYLDTGLFLDHRPMRRLLREQANGKRFLNLFGYTGSATIAAAAGGARETVTVDLSNTYLDWAERNLELNRLSSPRHELIRMDVLKWLHEPRKRFDKPFDLIFLDPPTFSKSKSMTGTFDVQRDHADLIEATLRLLSPGGTLYFSTNLRNFRLDEERWQRFAPFNLTPQTIDPDFQRNSKIHCCWRFQNLSKSTALPIMT